MADTIVVTEGKSYTLEEVFDLVESQSAYFFSYNVSVLPLNENIVFPNRSLVIQELISIMSDQLGLSFDISGDKVIVSLGSDVTIRGVLIDSISGESIAGAYLICDNQYLGSTDVNGYFSISLNKAKESISIYNIGYNKKVVQIDDVTEAFVEINLSPRVDFDVVILGEDDVFDNPNQLDAEDIENHYGTAGSKDLLQAVKFLPGVSNGYEGQNGFTVRGGGPHQNLIFIDGMPLYEASHLGGLSSVFLSSSIKDVHFYKSAFPSKYGGRLSSVLDVRLQDGNRRRFDKELQFGLEGVSAHLDGPLSENTTININVRTSWFSLLASPVVKKFTEVDDLNLNYVDSYLKLSHWFSPTNKLSISAYRGSDLVRFSRNKLNDQLEGFRDFNELDWGNSFVALNWNYLLAPQWILKLQAGTTDYRFNSRGTYDIKYLVEDMLESRSLDILSISRLDDYQVNLETDYNYNDGLLRMGFLFKNHKNRPTIQETEQFAAGMDETPILMDTTYRAQEYALYLDSEYRLSEGLSLNTGLRSSYYDTPEADFWYIEPRLSLAYNSAHNSLVVSYARMSQFIHLLSNPGPGIPSDLWVPSTSRVEPELSNVFSVDYILRSKKMRWTVGAWYKSLQNLIDYSDVSDIIYSLIIDNSLYQVQVDNGNWEDRISFGSGYGYGFELGLAYNSTQFDFNLNYGYSVARRQFEDFDEGEAFPYKFDSPHNISSQLAYKINDQSSLRLNFQFASGTAYSLFDAERLGPDGQSILVLSSRNNFRLPDYHHLDIRYTLTKTLKKGTLEYQLGIYNVYNRRNAFYEYLIQDSESGPSDLVKISIFPILPQFNLSYSW